MPQSYQSRLQWLLDALVAHGDVPGAAAALLQDGEVVAAAAGVRNLATGEPATPDTLWQIGSLSKIYAATLAMILVQEGRLSLDAPVASFLPGGRLPSRDPEAAQAITLRQLLTHSSGLDADHYLDPGLGAGAGRTYLASLEQIGLLFPPGRAFSYSNAGYGLIEALVSLARDDTYAGQLGARLLKPIGSEATELGLERAVAYRLALGHARFGSEGVLRGPRWRWLDFGAGVGGVIASMPDVLRLAALHLDEGRTAEGREVLTPSIVAAMQAASVATPRLTRRGAVGRGLGWAVWDWGGVRVVGHDGDTVGQQALLLVIPERRSALAIVGNSNRSAPRLHDLAEAVLFERLGIAPTERVLATASSLEAEGRYERLHLALDVVRTEAGLSLSADPDPLFAPAWDLAPKRLLDLGEDIYAMGDAQDAQRLTFLDLEDAGRATHLHTGGRAHPLRPPFLGQGAAEPERPATRWRAGVR